MKENKLERVRERYSEERELLHKQIILLAEKSSNCTNEELAEFSKQMVNLYSALNNPGL